MAWADFIEYLCVGSFILCMMACFSAEVATPYPGFTYNTTLALFGFVVANLNKGRLCFIYLGLLGLSCFFDFIQMCIANNIGLVNSNQIFGWVMMLFNMFMKVAIGFCDFQLFRELGGSWSILSARGSAGGTSGGAGSFDSGYAQIGADGSGSSADLAAPAPYQSYVSPPVASNPTDTQTL